MSATEMYYLNAEKKESNKSAEVVRATKKRKLEHVEKESTMMNYIPQVAIAAGLIATAFINSQ